MEQVQIEYREMDIQKVNELLIKKLWNLQTGGVKTWLI